jgi:hypothetical protein
MTRRFKLVALIVAVVIAVPLALSRFGIIGLAHETTQLSLGQLGASVYEFHAQTGRWPASIDDLAQTSLARHNQHWESDLRDGVFVIVWPTDYSAEPKDNSARVLAYHNKGLLATQGHLWVCKGNLQTEYLPAETVRGMLAGQVKPPATPAASAR